MEFVKWQRATTVMWWPTIFAKKDADVVCYFSDHDHDSRRQHDWFNEGNRNTNAWHEEWRLRTEEQPANGCRCSWTCSWNGIRPSLSTDLKPCNFFSSGAFRFNIKIKSSSRDIYRFSLLLIHMATIPSLDNVISTISFQEAMFHHISCLLFTQDTLNFTTTAIFDLWM
jgi:hypothetical protein